MISPTIVTIVTVALSAIALVIIGVCVLKNLFRPVFRSGMQLAIALLCIPIALLLAKVVCGIATSTVLGMVDVEVLDMIIAELPSGQQAIEGLAQMVAAPFVFVLIYFILWIIVGAIVGIVVRSLEKGGVKFMLFKNKGIGAGIGVVCGLVLLIVYLVPLIGFTGIVPSAMTVLTEMEVDGEAIVELSEEDKGAIDKIVNTPALSVPRALGGKALFASLTTTKLDGEKFSLTREIDSLCSFAVTVYPVVEKAMDDISRIDEADVTVIQTELPALFENSTMLRVLGAETISGMSRAWLAGDSFLTLEKPDAEGVTAIVVDSALLMFADTTKDTIVDDIRGLTPMLSAALAVSKLQQGGDLNDILEQLAQAASSPEIKSLLLTAGVSIVAQELGLYNDKREIYDAYASTLATLSTANLTKEQLCREIEVLNDKYAISMTDEEIEALAASLLDNPYMGASAGDPSLALPSANTYPVLVPCSYPASPIVTVSEEDEDEFAAWLAAVCAQAAEQQETLSWLTEAENIPSALVTVEDLTALTTKEALEDFGEEEIKAVFSAAAQVMNNMSEGGELDLQTTIGALGDALGAVTATESGKALVETLVTGALQSDKVCETMGITPGQATTIANSMKENGGLENLGQTAKDVSNLMNVIGHLKEDVTSGGSVSPEDFHILISTMSDSSAAMLRSLCTPEMLKKAGLPEASVAGVAHLLDDLLAGLVEARKTWSEDAYQKEADALYRILQLAVGAKNSSGSTFEDRFGMSAEQLIETVQASELLTTVLPDSINELYAENPDALGLSTRLGADDRAQLLEKIAEYKQTADEGGDKLLDALARMLG